MKIIIGVYVITNTENGKVYVGSSQDIAYRWRKHREALQRGKHVNLHLQDAWKNYGESCFEWRVVEEVADISVLLDREQWWMDELNACDNNYGYNMAVEAGAPMRGRKASESTIEKLKQIWKGRKHTPETIEKMRQVHKGKQYALGRKISEKHRAAIIESNTRRGVSEATREKLRRANLGKKASEETRQKVIEINKNRERNPDGTFKS